MPSTAFHVSGGLRRRRTGEPVQPEVRGDDVPDRVQPGVGDAVVLEESRGAIGAVDLEHPVALRAVGQADVVQRADRIHGRTPGA
jgi:hypothetical protein